MANTYVDYTATAAQTDFAFTFPYLEDEHVTVEIDGVVQLTSAYSIVTTPSTKVVLNVGATAGQVVRVRRKSQPDTNLVDFENGSILTESELDRAYQHNRFLNEEIGELNDASLQTAAGTNNWDAGNNKIVNVATPTDTSDASTKDYVDAKVNQVSSGTSSPPTKWVFTGTAGANTTYSVTGAEVNGDTAYDVSIDGSVKEPTTDYTVDPDTDTLTIVPTLSGGEDIVVIERGFGIALTTGNLDSNNIANGAITTDKIADDSISVAKMKANSVDSDQYVDGSIDEAHIANNAVTSAKISDTDSNFNIQSDGKIGIGTASPVEKLTIVGDVLIDNNMDSTLYLGKGAEGVDGVTKIKSVQTGVDTDELGLSFFVHGSTAGATPPNEAFRIDHNRTVFIANAPFTPDTPTGGGFLYVESGALKYKGSSGTVTTLGTA